MKVLGLLILAPLAAIAAPLTTTSGNVTETTLVTRKRHCQPAQPVQPMCNGIEAALNDKLGDQYCDGSFKCLDDPEEIMDASKLIFCVKSHNHGGDINSVLSGLFPSDNSGDPLYINGFNCPDY